MTTETTQEAAPIAVTRDMLTEALTEFWLSVWGGSRQHKGQVDDPDLVADVLYATLSRIAAERGPDLEAQEAEAEHFARDVSLLAGARIISHTLDRLARTMEAARIEMQQSGPEKAMQWILSASEWPEDDGQGLAWDGKETARAWFDRVMAAEEPTP